MSSLLVFNRVYRLESGDTASHVGIFNQALWTINPLAFSLVHLPHPSLPSQSPITVYKDSVWLGEGGGVELSWVGDHILQEFN